MMSANSLLKAVLLTVVAIFFTACGRDLKTSLVQAEEHDSEMDNPFSANPLCNTNDQYRFDFAGQSVHQQITIVKPGATVEFTLNIQRDWLPAGGWSACGIALVVHHRTNDGESQIVARLQRGQGVVESNLMKSTPEYNVQNLVGQCHDRRCASRSGVAEKLVTPKNFGPSSWKLKLKNVGVFPVETATPYVLIPGMSD